MSTTLSPVEERHLDYILEEEFCVSSEFLTFFIEQARLSATDGSRIPAPIQEQGCRAVRSVTTESGESDVLVTYRSTAPLPIAIVIEDKIRASFQPDQPARYRARGEAGKGTLWSEYWTCLIAHQKYASSPGDFDAIVTLQQLQSYFTQRPDVRSQFRAQMLAQAIQKYETTGLQKKDDNVTRFRAIYALEFAARVSSSKWWHQPARDAWWGDRWFECRGTNWPKGVFVRHQSESGRMQLIFPFQDEDLFRTMVTTHAAWQLNGSAPQLSVVRVGKGKLAFQLEVPKMIDFASGIAPFEEFFSAIEYLGNFYERSSELLPAEFRPAKFTQPPSDDGQMSALQIMLLAYMRSTVIGLGTAMPFPLPDLNTLTRETPEEECHFPSMGLMGGFEIKLFTDSDNQPYVLATQSSRQWGTYEIQHKISASEVRLLNTEARTR